jgi:alpha-galactosidase
MENVAVAALWKTDAQAGALPDDDDWEAAPAVGFSSDWRGENADPSRDTEVRLLWNTKMLFVRFRARFREITVFEDAEPSGRRDQLWDRDVAEIFLQPDSSRAGYKEFQVSPNGFWIDLEIAPGAKRDLRSGLWRRVQIDKRQQTWTAELGIPMASLTPHFDSAATWRVNFYRVEGPCEPRFYSAWQPTNTPKPNFHVPEAFGYLQFVNEKPA